jgi:multicomponent Na+:H+ antiporter subunit D
LEQLPVIIPISLLFFSFIVFIAGTIRRYLAYPIALAGIAISFIASCLGLAQVMSHGPIHYYLGNWQPPIGIEYVLDYLSAFMAILITFIALITIVYSRRSLLREIPEKAHQSYALVLLLIAGLTGIVVTGDLFNLYVFLEIASLSAYALIAIGNKNAPMAAFRYLIMGTIGACFYLLGVGFIYFATGSLNMADVAAILPTLYGSPLILAAVVFIIIGMALKMALFPLHLWLPDAYTSAPSAVTALIAPIMTKVGAYVIIRMLVSVFIPPTFFEIVPVLTIVGWLAAIGIIATSIMAIAQKDLKRMLAYSSISQICYVALGISLANPIGLIGALLHILNHAFMKGCLFQVAGEINYSTDEQQISKFTGLGRLMPLPMGAFTVAALSMIGIPPTAGFFSKWYLVLGCVDNGNWIFAAVILISSLLNAVYFFRVLENIYIKKPPEDKKVEIKEKVPFEMLVPTLILAAGIIILGIINVLIVNSVLQPIANMIF